MKMLLSARVGSRTCDWSGYVLLRDNVPHSAGGSQPNVQTSALSSIQTAAYEGQTSVDAALLREEVARAWHTVLDIPLDRALRAPRAAVACGAKSDSPESSHARSTASEEPGIDPLAGPRVLAAAKRFVAAVLELTENLAEGETLEVRVPEDSGQFSASNRPGHSLASAGHGLARLGLKSSFRER